MDRLTKKDKFGWYVDDQSVPYDEKRRGIEIDRLAAFEDVYEAEIAIKRGKWIIPSRGKRYCSVCNKMACVTRDREDFWYMIGTPYCPYCGAKMDMEEEK